MENFVIGKKQGEYSSDKKYNWNGKVRVLTEVKILSYTPVDGITFDVEPSEAIGHEGFNPPIEKRISCFLVKAINVKVKDKTQREAEIAVLELAQQVADLIGYYHNRYVRIELEYTVEENGLHWHAYSPAYRQTEINTRILPQNVDLTKLNNLDEDIISQLSNYAHSCQDDALIRFLDSYKAIELHDENNLILQQFRVKRKFGSHGKLTINPPEEIYNLFKRWSLRPTNIPDREKFTGDSYKLQEEARSILDKKLKIKYAEYK